MGKPPLPPPGSEERRRSSRLDLLAQVQVRRGDGEVFLLPIVNISAGGAFLRLERGVVIPSVAVGDRVSIFLDLGPELALDLDAAVLRIDVLGGVGREAGIGLRWKADDPQQAAGLARALEQLAIRAG